MGNLVLKPCSILNTSLGIRFLYVFFNVLLILSILTLSTAQKVPTYVWSTAGLHENQEPFVQWAQFLNSLETVCSKSYRDADC